MLLSWRKDPPNDDERRACQIWWLRSSKSSNIHIVMFDRRGGAALIDYSTSAYLDILEWMDTDPGPHFDPNDWPGEWAPCLPPERKEQA